MISSLLFGITAFLYYKLFKKFGYKNMILIIIQMLAMFMLGTKVSTFGFLLSTVVMFIVYFVFVFIIKEVKFNYKIVLFILFIISSWLLIYPYSPCNNRISGVKDMKEIGEKNNKINDIKMNNARTIISGMNEEDKKTYLKGFVYENYYDFSIKKDYVLKKYPYQNDVYFWFNAFELPIDEKLDNRVLLTHIYDRMKEIDDRKLVDDMLGITYSRASHVGILERDFTSQYYSLGVIGFIIFILPYLAILLISGIYMIIKRKKHIFRLKNVSLIVMVSSGFIGAYFCGNTLDNLTFMIIYAFFLGQLLRRVFKGKQEGLNEKEITILALHLDVGGVEKYISSLCKMLENDYKIKIISTYKLSDKPAFEFSKKIDIEYLINDRPYKKELKDSIKNKRVFNIIKYGLKNIKIYILRYIKNIKAVKNIKSKYVITTRVFHNNIVSDDLDDNYIKIATEHNYVDNEKYVNKVVNSVKNFDYLVCVSEDLKNYYENLIKETKVVYIPNTIDEVSEYKKKKVNKNLISVGRFSKEKGFLDLLDVMSILVKKDKDYKLTLVGDGPDKDLIIDKINKLKLNKNVVLTGYIKDKELIRKYYDLSSLYVMTSYTESFGIVLLEAQSRGIPCVAFDSANGAKNLLKDTGILISNRDKNAMAEEIIKLTNNTKLYNEISLKSYDNSKIYDIVNVKKMWLKLLRGGFMKSYFDNLYKGTKDEFYKKIENDLKNSKKEFIITANAEIFAHSKKEKIIKDMIFDPNTTIIADGISVVKGARKLGIDVKERIPGVEVSEKLFEYGNKYKKSIYLYGAKEEVLIELEKILKEKYKDLKIVGLKNGYLKDRKKVFDDIKQKKPDIVLVALGVPTQEKLIYENLNDFEKGIFVGVGGSFDVLSGMKKRAPKLFIKTNTEWLYRIIKEPKRIKRFWNNNVKFYLNIKDYK